tara:strand:+ start:173 stop:418 length:246 start_codon:yes stop_codon:yes gene_type:complete
MNKLGLIVFYFLGVIDAVLNFIASLFFYYPKVELSIKWLVHTESIRVISTSNSSSENRQKMEEEAMQKKREAYTLDDGKDL